MNINDLIGDSLCTGAVATLATTAAMAACGAAEDDAIAPINAVGHIAFGDEAATHEEVSAKYTGTGLALNAMAVTGWSAVNELICDRAVKPGDVVGSLVCGAATAAMAYVTDYYLVPKRFTPGFEKRLSNRSLFAIYSTLALSLAAGHLMRRRMPDSMTFAT